MIDQFTSPHDSSEILGDNELIDAQRLAVSLAISSTEGLRGIENAHQDEEAHFTEPVAVFTQPFSEASNEKQPQRPWTAEDVSTYLRREGELIHDARNKELTSQG